jgi:hypothetical protein
MPSRPDLRELASNVKDAFADADRETLLDILTFVIKEYVVEGPPPMMIHQAETLSDVRGLSFAQLISALQTRLDHPELAAFVVDGEQVGVRVAGVVHPLLAGRQAPVAAPVPAPVAESPRPEQQQRPPGGPGARFIEAQGPVQRPQPRPQPPAPGQPAPPPTRGLSLRGQPGSTPPMVPNPPPPPPPAQPPAAGQQPAAAPSDKPEPSGDDASARFSLLELD